MLFEHLWGYQVIHNNMEEKDPSKIQTVEKIDNIKNPENIESQENSDKGLDIKEQIKTIESQLLSKMESPDISEKEIKMIENLDGDLEQIKQETSGIKEKIKTVVKKVFTGIAYILALHGQAEGKGVIVDKENLVVNPITLVDNIDQENTEVKKKTEKQWLANGKIYGKPAPEYARYFKKKNSGGMDYWVPRQPIFNGPLKELQKEKEIQEAIKDTEMRDRWAEQDSLHKPSERLDNAYNGIPMDEMGRVLPPRDFGPEPIVVPDSIPIQNWGPNGKMYGKPAPGFRKYFKKRNNGGMNYWTPKKTIFGNPPGMIQHDDAREEALRKIDEQKKHQAEEATEEEKRRIEYEAWNKSFREYDDANNFVKLFINKDTTEEAIPEPLDTIKKFGKEDEFKIFREEQAIKRQKEQEEYQKEDAILRDDAGHLNQSEFENSTSWAFRELGIYYDIEKHTFRDKGGVAIPDDMALRRVANLLDNKDDPEGDKIDVERYEKIRAEQVDSLGEAQLRDSELIDRIEKIPVDPNVEMGQIDFSPLERDKTDSDNFFKQKKLMYDWFTDPASIKKAAQLGITAEEYKKAVNNIFDFGRYYVDPSIGNIGETNIFTNDITVRDDNNAEVQTHELAHRTDLGNHAKIYEAIDKIVLNNPGYREYLKTLDFRNPEAYQYSPDEIYSRLWQLRSKYNLKPGQKVTPDMIKDYKPEELFNMNKNQMIYLLNLLVEESVTPKATIPYEDAEKDLLARNQKDDKSRLDV